MVVALRTSAHLSIVSNWVLYLLRQVAQDTIATGGHQVLH
jgi:hypothetical protein